ncbi:MAG: heavy metal translocating P-type ATPase, partial [Chloroflexota bacterium]
MVPVEQIQVGEIIIVKPGQRIPMDGRVVVGVSTVNEAPITGESMPRPKQPGNAALAGSLNQRGTLEIKITKPFQETVLAKVLHLVEAAQAERAPTQQFVERFARYYTPAVVALAVAVAAVPPLVLGEPLRPWLYRGLALLVVACPCALVISTPISIFSAITAAARRGILIKGGAYLEAMGKLSAVLFDKTGTLTWGCAYVSDVVTSNGYSDDQVLQLAASIEQQAEHPMAHAIVWEAKHRGLAPDVIRDFQSLPGMGARASFNGGTYYIGQARLFSTPPDETLAREMVRLQGEGKMVVLVGPQEQPLGLVALFDDLRASASPAIQGLRELGIKDIMMLSGDHAATAQAIAAKLAITEVKAELMPEDKLNVVRQVRQTKPVAMVGDGVNDAPALAASTVGVAMGTVGTDTALETADVVL